MQTEQLDIRDHLVRHPPFNALPEATMNVVASQIEVAYFKAGTWILEADQPINDLHYVRSGAVELYRRNGELYNRLTEGDLFGQIGLLMGQPTRFPARALEDTLIYFLPATLFKQLFKDHEAFATFVEVEDRSRLRHAATEERARNDLMTSTVDKLLTRDPILIWQSASVRSAAQLMMEHSVSTLLIVDGTPSLQRPEPTLQDDSWTMVGIVTDQDFRTRVVAPALPMDTPVSAIMSANPETIDAKEYVFDAMLAMMHSHLHHLPVMRNRRPIGVVGLTDVLRHESRNSLFVVNRIAKQTTVDGLQALVPDVHAAYIRMLHEGANSHMIGSAMAGIGRAFKRRLLQLAEAKLGHPPVPYCFLAMGSMARDEQSIVTDQDNALVLDDRYDPTAHGPYFADLAAFVCDGLDACGYSYCTGDIMATNPKWRQPLRVWQGYFNGWISQPNAEALLHSSIFFDLDGVYGQQDLADQLKHQIAEQASKSPRFLGCLARNALSRTPPLGFFRDFVMEHDGKQNNVINTKRRGTAPMVDVIRVHALASGSRRQNSFLRLQDIEAKGMLTSSQCADLRDALEFVSRVRIRHQVLAMEAGQPPDNRVAPEALSAFERRHLKDAFQILSNAQKFIKFRYPLTGGR